MSASLQDIKDILRGGYYSDYPPDTDAPITKTADSALDVLADAIFAAVDPTAEKSFFSAYNNAVQSMPATPAWEKVEFNTERDDDGSDFNTSTHEYTAPNLKTNTLGARVRFYNVSSGDRLIMRLDVNGTKYRIAETVVSDTIETLTGTEEIKLPSSAVVFVEVYNTGGACDISSGSEYSSFWGGEK
ncbi:MAG: hypothetical protein JRD89_01430 [Deltaproteobacteria bacterium]|nr:hypothetical protein [Deltaproteobacteria bacterium]